METASLPLWIGFNLFVLGMLALDLGVFHRKAHEVSFKEAATWSAVWVALALAFNAGVWHWFGPQKGTEFLTGYLIEKSLSIDNIFVFALIFSYFAVPAAYQHRVLFWGILGALVLRAIFIAAGSALLTRFHWIIYVFGAFLVLTGLKMALAPARGLEPDKNPVLRLVRRLMPVTDRFHGQSFFVRENGARVATPLFLVLVLVETTDLIFAVDSIPAIFAITTDPFIVYTSNVFAILGLRSLYFLLAGIMHRFEYLKLGLAAVLVFVGAKMALVDVYKIPAAVSLGVVATLLAAAIVASLVRTRGRSAPPAGAAGR
ncbi:MAG: TerC family protein [Thermoanaerobaculia bacterium]|nr:MAG: TerC family protein [Thermoanaerobaculia bacterium]